MKKTTFLVFASASIFTVTGIFLTAIGKGDPAFQCPDGKTYPVTLTFDDGPNPTLTPKVLDILKTQNVKATFFVLGDHFPGGKSNPSNKSSYDILDREKREGHYIGSHTYSHLAHNTLSEEKARENINKGTEVLKDYLSPVLRLPYGAGSFHASTPAQQEKNNMVMGLVKSSGFSHVGWDIDTNDWDVKKRAQVLPSMMKQICAEKGGIILFHDIQKNTVDHLNEWIQAIKDQGHTIVGLEHFRPEVKNAFQKQVVTPRKSLAAPAATCDPLIQQFREAEELNKLVEEVIRKENMRKK